MKYIIGIIIGALVVGVFLPMLTPTPTGSISGVSSVQTQTLKDYRSMIDSMEFVIGRLKMTLPIMRVDTIPDPLTGHYRIPIMPYVFQCSVPFRIDKQISWYPFIDCIDGYVTEHTIITKDTLFFEYPKVNVWKERAIGGLVVGLTLVAIAILK